MRLICGVSNTLRNFALLAVNVEEDGIFLLYVKVWYVWFIKRIFSGLRSVWMRLRS